MYVRHLLIAPSSWLAAALASRRRVFTGCRAPGGWSANTGDPVFLLGDEEHVRAYARVSASDHMTLGAAHAKFRGWLFAVCGDTSEVPLYTAGPRPGEMGVDVLYLAERTPIEPALGLRELGIAPPAQSAVRQIEPEEVLALLKALPPAAQDDWTKRVVARDNGIPRFRRGGVAAG
jgi:hypothetical protein